MDVLNDIERVPDGLKGGAIAIGNFDGVHLGHQAILRRVIQRAGQVNGAGMVYTFDPHPLKILAPERSPALLTSFKKKMELIEANGIEITICADFTRSFARIHPRDFARKLMDALTMDTVVVGHDYSFGYGKTGTIDYLCKMGEQMGFRVEVVDAVTVDNTRVSSTLARQLISEGNVTLARRMLNRFYSIAGKVVSGYKRGKIIGFPTANLDTPYELIPAVGIYAALVKTGHGQTLAGVVNIGYNPTFDRDDLIVETHIMDYDGDLYGTEIEICFVERLRDERNFDSADELRAQISADVEKARGTLKPYLQNSSAVD